MTTHHVWHLHGCPAGIQADERIDGACRSTLSELATRTAEADMVLVF